MNKMEKALSQILPSNSVRDMTLLKLQSTLDIEKIDNVFTKISNLINQSIEDKKFYIILDNEFIDEFFVSTEEEALDEDLIEFTVNYLKREGYTVNYDEILYNDFKSIIEIHW